MLNFTKYNLVTVDKKDIDAGHPAVKIDDALFLLQRNDIPKGSTMDFFKCAVVADKAKEPIPEPIFAEKFNGTLTNNFTQLAEAPVFETIDGRQCMKCDYDHRLSHSAEALPAGNSPRTMSAWVYCNEDSLSGEWSFICGYGWTDPETFYIAVYWGDLLCYHAADYPYDPWSALGGNAWKHVTLSFDGKKVTGYINGVKIGETVGTFDTNVTDQPLCIGWISTDDRPFSTDAYISDLQIYDVALSAEQVEELHQSQTTSLIFNAPLSSQSDTALTGQTLNVSGEVSYTNFNGVDCVLIPDQYNYIYFSDDGFPSGDSDRTICCRMCTEGAYTAPFPFCGYGYEYQQSNFYMSLREGTFGFDTNFVGEKTSQTFDTTVWNFYAVRVKDGQVTAIVNDYKEELSHDSFYTELNGRFQIGRWCDHTSFGGRMYICDVQVYNTALSDDQLMKLYDPSYEPEAPLPPNTWNGYKAVLVTDTDGGQYYEFEETLTEGLTFGKGFTPVVDKVYDSEAMIMATLSEKNKYPEIASPMNMTDYTKDNWVVSASYEGFGGTKAWNGFYPDGIWVGRNSNPWLQWQNTTQQVLVRQISFGYGGNSNWVYTCRLEGSDDGNTWTEIGTRDCEYDSDSNTILTFPDNNTAYYYHRLVSLNAVQGYAVVGYLLAKRDVDGRTTP